MVLGIGEGKVILTLTKTIYSAGEPITGKARLELSAPKKARALRLDIYHEIQERSGRHSATKRIVDFTQNLAGEKMYGSGEEFEFSALAPAALAIPKMEGAVGTMMNALSFLIPKPRYFVSVSLDTPLSFDISARVQVQMQDKA
ncbi:MAG: hypothetical protein WC717_06480 [Candidatus Micrarchaeia archaeon]